MLTEWLFLRGIRTRGFACAGVEGCEAEIYLQAAKKRASAGLKNCESNSCFSSSQNGCLNFRKAGMKKALPEAAGEKGYA